MSRRILVVGPPLAGVDGVIEALRTRLPDDAVVGVGGLQGPPDAVVAVLSAAAPMTRSDWASVARVAAATDLLVGAVSKIDAHRSWRDVLGADRSLVTDWEVHRRPIHWVGVAAAPRLGEPNVVDLVTVLGDGLADPTLDARNRLRRSDSRSSPRGDPAVAQRLALQRMRLRLLRHVRDRCATIRTDLREAASAVSAGGAAAFEARVRDDVAEFVAALDGEITRAVDEAAAELSRSAVAAEALVLPHVEAAPSASRRLETQLMAVLGMGVGLGIALAASRLLAGVAPGLSMAGWVAGAVVGSAVVGWVVRTRGILRDRALLDRWVADVAATLRWHGEAMVADRLLAVEHALVVGARAEPHGGPKVVTDQ